MRSIVLTAKNVTCNIILCVIAFHALLLCNSVFFPVSAQEHIQLEALTDQGTFKIQIIWILNTIGNANVFEIHFIDPDTGDEIEDVKYDISIYREGKLEVQQLDQVMISQEFSFDDVGPYEIRIDDVEDLDERAVIPIQVTPEFGIDMFILSATALGLGMLAVWRNSKNLFRRVIN